MTVKMKGISKVLGTIKRKPTLGAGGDGPVPDLNGDSPEATASRAVKQFCESGGSQTGDDITFLPSIVDAAESSPVAAAECARIIRKFLGRDYWSKPSYQYNAIMLIRILSDNPGATFTRNLDKKFTDVTKELLRNGRDPNVRQMLMETLDTFENTKGYDEGLGTIIEMWKKEKEKAYRAYGGVPQPVPRVLNAPPFDARQQQQQQEYFSRAHSNKKIPNPVELANRLEEARTSAKLLEQVVGCTPPTEILSNDLIKEFADRCLSASRSIQGYMTADPAPDNDTMESLLDTNEQLQRSLNQHQRAVLQAKKHLGLGEPRNSTSPPGAPPSGPPDPQVSGGAGPGSWQPSPDSATATPANFGPPPPLPDRKAVGGNGKGKATDNEWDRTAAGPSRSNNATPQQHADDDGDPFRDPVSEPSSSRNQASGGLPSLPYEPFHPGFNPSTHGKETGKPDPVTPVSDDGLYNDDRYGSTPKKPAEHVYRY